MYTRRPHPRLSLPARTLTHFASMIRTTVLLFTPPPPPSSPHTGSRVHHELRPGPEGGPRAAQAVRFRSSGTLKPYPAPSRTPWHLTYPPPLHGPLRYGFVVVDESHCLKGRDTKRTQVKNGWGWGCFRAGPPIIRQLSPSYTKPPYLPPTHPAVPLQAGQGRPPCTVTDRHPSAEQAHRAVPTGRRGGGRRGGETGRTAAEEDRKVPGVNGADPQ